MRNICKLLVLTAILCSLFLSSCRKENNLHQKNKNTAKSLKANTESNAPNPIPVDYVLEFSEDCKYIGNRHPDSGYKAIKGTLECYNKKPAWWPDFNQKVYYPSWVWQRVGGYDPNDHKKLQLQVPPEKMFFLPHTDKDDVYALLKAKILQSFPVRFNKLELLSVADLGLRPDEVLFLDNYFAERILLMDGLRASFPNNSGLSLDDVNLLEIYMSFKTRASFLSASSNSLPLNFFGENNIDHLSQFLYTQYSNNGFYINWNVPQYWTYRTTQVSSIFDTPISPVQKLYVILPKYYLYIMVQPISIRSSYLFLE